MRTTCLFRIEVICPGNLDVCKEMFVSLCGNRRSDRKGALWVDSTTPMDLYVAMGRNRSYGQKKWFASLDRIIKKPFRFVGQDVGSVLPLMADRWVSVPLPSAVVIFVRIRV